ncbi:MAG: diphthamide synthesis protein [Candidatus Altiarchaeota archaeon]|nr:diphthamide synthesis protein [Candidatus Altiarchaeota archaeon]
MSEYDFELDKILKEIKSSEAGMVALQFPEGLKTYAVSVAAEVEDKTNATALIFVDPTYGACDIKECQLEKLGVDLLVHFGHTKFLED